MRTPLVWWRLCGVSAVVAVVTALLLAFSRPQPQPAPTPTAPTEEIASVTRPPQPLAIVGQWEGKLAVFRTEGAPPEEVYDLFVASLPAAEQEALAAGIPVYDEVALQQLLEDYTG